MLGDEVAVGELGVGVLALALGDALVGEADDPVVGVLVDPHATTRASTVPGTTTLRRRWRDNDELVRMAHPHEGAARLPPSREATPSAPFPLSA